MPVFRLNEHLAFPSPIFAEPDGLLAVGGDLSPDRLILAYANGIFPWYSAEDPILWWSPAPRMVLFPDELHVPKRLQRALNKNIFTVTANTAFEEVIVACANGAHRCSPGTWITPEMQEAYTTLHRLGFAHSIECWHEERLAGGLYGVCIDHVFFGESMFTSITNGSKIALVSLAQAAIRLGIHIIDCQMTTDHLQRFGARELSREDFLEQLESNIESCSPRESDAWNRILSEKSTRC